MIDALINRIKDAYFDLDRDTARRSRFVEMTQAFTPGAIQMSPAQMQFAGQFPPNTPNGPSPELQQLPPELQQPGMGTGAPEMGTPPPPPSMLDMIAARR
jgi:hypothetical protein